MIIAADGSGDFTSIQAAIDTVPPDNSKLVTIFIKSGVYKEKLHIETPYVRLVGEAAESTVITFDDYAKKRFVNGDYYNTFHSYSVLIGTDDFQAENLAIVNSAGRGEAVGQAVAAYVDGDRVSFRNCRFIGCQDTLFTGPLPDEPIERAAFGGPRDLMPRRNVRQYYEKCYIEGDVDFIFGSATAVFNGCEIFSKNRAAEKPDEMPGPSYTSGWITAASTPEDVGFGYVFIDCRLTGDAPRHSVYLGRPWRNHANVAFLDCWMGDHIKPEGWHNWGKPESERTTRYCEYNSSGPGAASIGQRAPWSYMMTREKAAVYSIANVLSGKDGWNPKQTTF